MSIYLDKANEDYPHFIPMGKESIDFIPVGQEDKYCRDSHGNIWIKHDWKRMEMRK